MKKKQIAIMLIIVLIINLILVATNIINFTVFWAIILIIFFVSNKYFGQNK